MPLEDVLNPPDEEAAVPQAASDKVARSLVGDDLVNRYGDVLGTRKATVADALRDGVMSMNSEQGSAGLAQLKLQVRDEFDKRKLQAERRAVAQQEIAKSKIDFAFDVRSKVMTLPKGARAGAAKEMLTQAGFDTQSNAALKLFLDPDFFDNDVIDGIRATAGDDYATLVEQFQGFFAGDLSKAIAAANGIKEANAKERAAGLSSLKETTERLRQDELRAKIAAGPGGNKPTKYGDERAAAIERLRARGEEPTAANIASELAKTSGENKAAEKEATAGAQQIARVRAARTTLQTLEPGMASLTDNPAYAKLGMGALFNAYLASKGDDNATRLRMMALTAPLIARALGDVGAITEGEQEIYRAYGIPSTWDTGPEARAKFNALMGVLDSVEAGLTNGTIKGTEAAKDYILAQAPLVKNAGKAAKQTLGRGGGRGLGQTAPGTTSKGNTYKLVQ